MILCRLFVLTLPWRNINRLRKPQRAAPLPRSAPPPNTSAIAEQALAFLVDNPDELLRFMETVGLDPNSLRRSVGSEAFSRGLIDYVASNEPLLLAVCANAGITPESFMRVWAKLNPAG